MSRTFPPYRYEIGYTAKMQGFQEILFLKQNKYLIKNKYFG